jgi:hypothetical protein
MERSGLRQFSNLILYGLLAVAGGFVGGIWATQMGLSLIRLPVASTAHVATGDLDVVRARKVVIVDSSGETRAVLSTEESAPHKYASLIFYDPSGPTARISPEKFSIGAVAIEPGGIDIGTTQGWRSTMTAGSVMLNDPKRAYLNIWPTSIAIDSSGSRAFLSTNMIAIHNGQALLGLNFDESGNPSLGLADTGGRTRVQLGATEVKEINSGNVIHRSPSSLVLFGEDGRVVWEAP